MTYYVKAVTLWILAHQLGMDVGLFPQRPPSLLDDLFPVVKQDMDQCC